VLKYGDNGKAFFRVGQALHHLGRNEIALVNLEQSLKFLPEDSISFQNLKLFLNPNPNSSFNSYFLCGKGQIDSFR